MWDAPMSHLTDLSSSNPAWSVVFTTYNVAEAHIVAGRLQSEGIHAWVHQEPMGSAIGITVGPLGEVRVLVNEADFEAALDILNQTPPHILPEDVDQIIFDDVDSEEVEDEDE